MSSNKMDVEIKEMMLEQHQEMPEFVRKRIDGVLLNLPDKRNKRPLKMVAYATAVAVMIMIIAGFGAFSPQIALALNQPAFAQSLEESAIVQTVQSVFNMETTRTKSSFKIPKSNLLVKAYEEGHFIEVGQAVTDQDLTIELTEVLYDGVSLAIGIVVTAEDNFEAINPNYNTDTQLDSYRDELRALRSQLQSTHMNINVNGESLTSYGWHIDGDFVDHNRFAGIITLQSGTERLPVDPFQLDLDITRVSHINGSWPFTLTICRQNSPTSKVVG